MKDIICIYSLSKIVYLKSHFKIICLLPSMLTPLKVFVSCKFFSAVLFDSLFIF